MMVILLTRNILRVQQSLTGVSAYILKWVSEGRLVDEVDEVGLIFKKDKLSLKIVTSTRPESMLEKPLWDMVVKAAGKDQILSEKEFNSYVRGNIKKFNKWTKSVIDNSDKKMKREGYIKESTENSLKIFTVKKFTITEIGQELGDNIFKFENYLRDFSLIEERGVSHVALWQELMVWAAYLGIAEEVYEQLKIVNPRIDYEMPYNAQTITMTHHFARVLPQLNQCKFIIIFIKLWWWRRQFLRRWRRRFFWWRFGGGTR